MWWPRMYIALEERVKGCHECQAYQKLPSKAPLHPWEYPSQPWSRIHVDYAGPVEGKMLFILVDAYSKWIEVYVTSKMTSEVTIDKLRDAFAAHGIPQTLVSWA